MAVVRTMTPQDYKLTHAEFKIIYSFQSTPFGDCLMGITSNDGAVAYLSFIDKGNKQAVAVLKRVWPLTDLIGDTSITANYIMHNLCETSVHYPLSVVLKGTEFQMKVWESLMQIPRGTTYTYEQIAMIIGNPKAWHAVGRAVKKNNVALLVPCHRVMGTAGTYNYRWGASRKAKIIAHEGN